VPEKVKIEIDISLRFVNRQKDYEMDVDGITENGLKEPIIRKGEWAFNI